MKSKNNVCWKIRQEISKIDDIILHQRRGEDWKHVRTFLWLPIKEQIFDEISLNVRLSISFLEELRLIA